MTDPHPMVDYLRSRATRADAIGGGAYVVYLSDAERAVTQAIQASPLPALSQRCHEAVLRVDHILHLDTMAIDLDTDTAETICDALTQLGLADESIDADEVADSPGWLLSELGGGWLVQAATPVRASRDEPFSWGYTAARWFHAGTYESAVDQALVWAEQCPAPPIPANVHREVRS